MEGFVIFSKDVDFYDRALLFGKPPQVVHVAVGNCSNIRLFSLLAAEWDAIDKALASGSSGWLSPAAGDEAAEVSTKPTVIEPPQRFCLPQLFISPVHA